MQEISIQLPNANICGIAFNDPAKPMILALHGWLDNAASFVPLAEYFQDYHLVALDLPGHGHSTNRSEDAHYHFVDFVQDLHAIVLQQNWRDFILLGHSMGGIIGSLYTACFPEYVTKFISIESFGPMTKEAESSPEQLRTSIESRIDAQAKITKHPDNLETVIQARAKAGDLSYTSAKMLVERNLDIQGDEILWRTDRKLRTFSSLRMTEEQAKAFLLNIACPVLAIRGSKGFDMMRQRLLERQQWVAQLEVVECAGGHHLHMDNPLQVAREVIRFLSDR